MSHRIEKFTSTLKHTLADILLNDVQNPHIKSLTITDIVVTPDLKTARIYVAAVGENIEMIMPQLKRATGYIKKTLAKKMYLKYVPGIQFVKSAVLPEIPGQDDNNDNTPSPGAATFGNIDSPQVETESHNEE